MPGRSNAVAVAALALALALAPLARAQQPTPEPQPAPAPTQEPEPKPAPKPAPPQDPVPPPAEPPVSPPSGPGQAPVNQTDKASELLRKILGLKPGPADATPVPAGPAAQPPPGGVPQEPGQPTGQAQEPRPQDPAAPEPSPPEPRPQEPGSQRPGHPEPGRDVDTASRAIEQLLPGARPAPAAPIPPTEPGVPPTAAVPPLPPAREMPGGDLPPPGVPWTGSLRTRYRARTGGGDDDHDLVSLLSFDLGDTDRHAVTAHALLRAFADLDGREPEGRFAGLDQSLGDEFDLRAYEAWLDWHRPLPAVELVRLGRQPLDDPPVPLQFDGVLVRTARRGPLRVGGAAYGGVPVHHFEASARGDEVWGAAFELSPVSQGDLRLDWMRLRDRLVTGARDADVWSAQWTQTVAEIGRANARHVWKDGRPYEWQLGADLHDPAAAADLQVQWRELLSTERGEVTELDPFTAIGLERRPYRQFDAHLGLDLGPDWTVGTGAAVRRLRDAGDEGAFNREFERWSVDATATEVLAGVDLSVDGSMWNSQGEDSRSVAGSLVWRATSDLRCTAGSAYDLYKYDALADRERDHVRSWFARLDWRPGRGARVDVDYAYERDETDRFHTFRLGVTWTF